MRRSDAGNAAIKQLHAERVLQLRDRLGYDGIRHGQFVCSSGHAARLGHNQCNMQVPKLDAAADTICPFHSGKANWLGS